jgi:hypothetical protein
MALLLIGAVEILHI